MICFFIVFNNGVGILICFLLVMYFCFVLGVDLFYVDECCVGNFGFMVRGFFIFFIVIYVSICIFDIFSIFYKVFL